MRLTTGLVVIVSSSAVLACVGGARAQVEPHAGMLRFPDVSASHIVFVYANDLWVVPREGGLALPLASPPGAEVFPKFSGDGKTIAFVGNYDGGRDIYTVPGPPGGGLAMRVTHHPTGENLCEWTSDGKLLFSAGGVSGLARTGKLYTVSAAGGLPQELPIPYGANGTINADGTWLAYTPHSIDFRTWKRYRGGMATDIWLFNLKDHTSKRITDWEGTDTLPMWHGAKVYYLSDDGPSHRLNIWSYDTATSQRAQVTRFDDHDVKWPSIGPGPNGQGEIVFQHGSKLYLLDLASGQHREVNVTIPGDRPTIRTRSVNAAEFITWWDISATGKRAVVEARGDVWTLPSEEGAPRNLTSTSGVAERVPTWSPDGRWIAYFSDASGEYELYITQSDGKGETKQLTSDGNCFRYTPLWSPDSKRILFGDKTGSLWLHTIAPAGAGGADDGAENAAANGGDTKLIDKDPWNVGPPSVSWSHDNRWIAYDRTLDERPANAIFIYNVESGEAKQATSGVFSDRAPVFDRKGDYLYFTSSRAFNPRYGDIQGDTTFIYDASGVLLAVPLRADMDYVWTPKSDEETWKDEKPADEEAADEEEGEEGDEADKEAGDDEGKGDDEADKADEGAGAAKPDDGVSGTWEGTAETPEGPMPFTLTINVAADNSVTGEIVSALFSAPVSGTYAPATGEMTLTASVPGGPVVTLNLKIEGQNMTGTGTADGQVAPLTATRTAPAAADEGGAKPDKEKEKPREEVTIDFDGFEQRAIQLPVSRGSFGKLAVNDSGALIYVRQDAGGIGPGAGMYLFDLKDDKKEEKSVAAGATSFEISADGKKLLVIRGPSASIQGASAGATGKPVITAGMTVQVEPREEWNQIFNDAWRMFRDFFYVSNMHGLDWPAIRDHYAAMLPDTIAREDLSYIISEMISELNVGHAYYFGGDVESQPNVPVGMLGVDFTLENGAYRIAKIHQGGPWDADARGPLSQPGVKVNEGDYLLAVNGRPLDISKDPWAAFIGTAGQVVTLTLSDKPEKDDTAREVLVKPAGGEGDLRYRAWIEQKRAYVDEKSNGDVGYIYVPNTGIGGQSDLVRQFYGQVGKKALIIDERWNGGGQIPTRFIELLNRRRTNYWARRDGKDWAWPPDSHQGPKCMLINGLAGSGGDMFPWLFKQAGLGPLIGTRTWGGLVGISGNPSFVDGGAVRVPTFGFYETDGTWGVEGHGTDPDYEVIDDPALMVNGGDPQLDKAIELMMEAIKQHPYVPATRPAPPVRTGMGIEETDK